MLSAAQDTRDQQMPTIKLPASVEQLATIREFVVQASQDLALGDRTIYEVELAVDEACSNVIRHAYRGQEGAIEVSVEPYAKGVEVVIRDWGEPFDPQAVPVPDVKAPLGQRQLGGLGLYIMRQIMDEVHFAFDAELGNTLTMRKRRRQGEEKNEHYR
jgi:serine/threonine-protein kinase RsbW